MRFYRWNRGNYAVAAWIILCSAELFVTLTDALWNVELDLRKCLSFLRHDLSVDFSHDMKDDAVVGRVTFVVVSVPVRRAEMHLHIARPNRSSQSNLRIEEVRTLVVIVQTWVDDLQLLPILRCEWLKRQYLVLPYVVQQPFHTYFGSVNLFCETKVRKIARKAVLLHENYSVTYENSTYRVRQDGPYD